MPITIRTNYGYSISNYSDVVILKGNAEIKESGYSFQKIGLCILGKRKKSGERVWSDNPLTLKEWQAKVNAALDNKANKPIITAKEIEAKLIEKDRPLKIISATYIGMNKPAKFTCLVNASHTWQTTPGHVINRNQGCPYCAGNQPLTAEIVASFGKKNRWVLDLTSFDGLKKPAQWHCQKHHSDFTKKPEKIIYRNSGCIECGRERIALSRLRAINEIKEILIERKIAIVDEAEYKDTRKKIHFKCLLNKQHKHWSTSVSHVVNDTNPTGCPTCSNKIAIDEEDLNIRLKKRGIALIKESLKGGIHSAAKFKCLKNPSHEVWSTVLNNVWRNNNPSGCPACANRGFDPTKTGYLYMIKLFHKQWKEVFGYGITTQWDRRWSTHKKNLLLNGFTWDEPEVYKFQSGYECQKAEAEIKKILKEKRLNINLEVEGFISEAATLEGLFEVFLIINSYQQACVYQIQNSD